MKRKTFIEIIAHIQAQQRRDSEISQLLGGITDETAVYITQLVTNLVITLEDEFNDADQTISWWLWDAPHAGEVPESCYITDEKRRKEWHITDAGKLYDYLDEFTDVVLETIELGATAFEDKYHQVAAACGAEFVDVNDIKIIGQDNRPTINNLRKSNA